MVTYDPLLASQIVVERLQEAQELNFSEGALFLLSCLILAACNENRSKPPAVHSTLETGTNVVKGKADILKKPCFMGRKNKHLPCLSHYHFNMFLHSVEPKPDLMCH